MSVPAVGPAAAIRFERVDELTPELGELEVVLAGAKAVGAVMGVTVPGHELPLGELVDTLPGTKVSPAEIIGLQSFVILKPGQSTQKQVNRPVRNFAFELIFQRIQAPD